MTALAALTGRPDGPGLLPPHRTVEAARRWAAWLRDATAGRVDVDGAVLLTERAALTGRGRNGSTSVGGACRLLEATDGWVAVSCARPDDADLVGALIGEAVQGCSVWQALAGWCASRKAGEVVERATVLGLPAAAAGEWRTTVPDLPPLAAPVDLTGRLVVDFSALWAGPLCAHLLGLAGANVVKVETPGRPDGARSGHRGFYDLLHAGHRAVAVDPASAHDMKALSRLVQRADIVIEASRPRALARWGLDAVHAVDNGAVWASITAYGRDFDRVGFGDDVAVAAGLIAIDPDNGMPVFYGDAVADPLTGLYAACRAVEAVASGSGALLDIPMVAVASLTAGPSEPARVVGSPPPLVARKPPATPAAPLGQDTAAVFAEIGHA